MVSVAIRPRPPPPSKVHLCLELFERSVYYFSDHRICFGLPSSCEFPSACDGHPTGTSQQEFPQSFLPPRPYSSQTHWTTLPTLIERAFLQGPCHLFPKALMLAIEDLNGSKRYSRYAQGAMRAQHGQIITADVSMSLDNVLAAVDAARASLGPVLPARVLDRAGWRGGRFEGGWLPSASPGVPLRAIVPWRRTPGRFGPMQRPR